MALTKVRGQGLESLSDGVTITTADNTDQLTLTSTDADANSGPNLRLYRNSSSPADDDFLGTIDFEGRNDNSQDFVAARIFTFTPDVSDGSEDAQLQLSMMKGGSSHIALEIKPDELIINNGSVDMDTRIESDGNANMVFVDAGNNKVAVGTATATATLTVEGSAVGKTDTDTSNSGSVTLDYTTNQNFVLTMTGNVTLANPTTENVGQSGFITFIQDGTGSRVLSVGSQYFCAGGAVIVLSTAANSIDIVPYVVIAAGKICLGAPQLAFADAS